MNPSADKNGIQRTPGRPDVMFDYVPSPSWPTNEMPGHNIVSKKQTNYEVEDKEKTESLVELSSSTKES